MQFEPVRQTSIDGIEKGIFTCYEVKSCKGDFKSGFGQNFVGEKNYFVMPMGLYKELRNEIPRNVGVLVPIPVYGNLKKELENPSKLDEEKDWKLAAVKLARVQSRQKPLAELLFCMLRSGR